MTKTVAQFKAAFKLGAETKNKKIRWNAPAKFWQSQTSLKDVKKTLDELDGCPDDERKTRLAAVRKAIADLDPKKRAKYDDALKDLEKELDQLVVASEQTLAGPPKVEKFETGGGTFGFRAEDGTIVAENLKKERVEFAHNVMGRLKQLAATKKVAIDDLGGLLETILKDTKMGASSSDVDGTVWAEAIKHVEDVVLPGIARDMDQLKAAGLVGDGAALKGVRFTGSDFHKGGKQVVILRFQEGGQEKKVVYKPSSLKVDSLLFGKDSVAAKLGNIQTYNIVAAESDDDPPKDLGFGYMEFVDTQGGPTDSADVIGVYKSIAAAMAMSYYVGLEDVHHENVLMKKGSVQVIDMEATTGTFLFPTKNADKGGGFIDQQWGKAINDGFKQKLLKSIDEGKLKSLPKLDAIESAMVTEFRAVATNWAKQSLKSDLEDLEKALAKQKTRLVPIATEGLQGLIPIAQDKKYPIKPKEKDANLANWIEFVDQKLIKAEEDQAAGESSTFIGNLIGSTSTPAKTVRNLIVSPGAYAALVRGDVPYYVRELGSSKVFDESGAEIAVPGLKKVGQSIAQEMAQRRTTSPDQAVSLFKLQGVALVKAMHKELETRLASKG
jgi:Domain of unknown function (DUF4135)